MEFRKKVMKKNEGIEDVLDTIQKNTESAAGKVAHHTKAKEKNNDEYTTECLNTWGSCSKVHSKDL